MTRQNLYLSFLSFAVVLYIIFTNANFGCTETAYSADENNLQIQVRQLADQIEVISQDASKLRAQITKLDRDVERIAGRLSPEQKEFCEKICWIQENAPIIDKWFKDIGSAKLDFASGYWSIVSGIALMFIGFITIVGFGFYRFLSIRLRNEVTLVAETEMHKASGRLYTNIGLSYWTDYKITKNKEYLKQAIYLTEKAYSFHGSKLDERLRTNELLICTMRNNLAYYLAERKRPEDKEVARRYAEYIRQKMPNYPEYKERWNDTYNFVLRQYP